MRILTILLSLLLICGVAEADVAFYLSPKVREVRLDHNSDKWVESEAWTCALDNRFRKNPLDQTDKKDGGWVKMKDNKDWYVIKVFGTSAFLNKLKETIKAEEGVYLGKEVTTAIQKIKDTSTLKDKIDEKNFKSTNRIFGN